MGALLPCGAARKPTEEAAGDLVHVSASLQGVQAQDDEVELLVEGHRLLLNAAEVGGDGHASNALGNALRCDLRLGPSHVLHPAVRVGGGV